MNHLETIINDNIVWNAISTYTFGIARPSTGAFDLKLNCPMCVSRGQTPDKRQRCGIIHAFDHIGIHCFNCDFRSRFVVGTPIGHNMMRFLTNLGMPEREVKHIQMRTREIARFAETVAVAQQQPVLTLPQFVQAELPPGSRSLEEWADSGCIDENYLAVTAYLLHRGDAAATAIPYYWTPDPANRINRRLIIPCLHHDRLVGWMGRSIDPTGQKYYKQIPRNFLFNSRFLTEPNRKYIFIVEGVFDALVIDGVAAMGASLNEQQIGWINQSDKIPVVVPDRDEAGKRLVMVALKQGWSVAIPNYGGRRWWDGHIKDVDEAVARHGRLFTLQSIISTMTNDPQIIRQRISYTL